MPERIVIADASTLIGLENIGRLELLELLYAEITLTTIVSEEVGLTPPIWMHIDDGYRGSTYEALAQSLGAGEASAIALALEREDALLLIDERKGRRRAAGLGLAITGVLGVLIKAHQVGYLPAGKRALDDLRASGFRLSDGMYELARRRMSA